RSKTRYWPLRRRSATAARADRLVFAITFISNRLVRGDTKEEGITEPAGDTDVQRPNGLDARPPVQGRVPTDRRRRDRRRSANALRRRTGPGGVRGPRASPRANGPGRLPAAPPQRARRRGCVPGDVSRPGSQGGVRAPPRGRGELALRGGLPCGVE